MTDDECNMEPIEREFHASQKPAWGPRTTLVYAITGKVTNSKAKSNHTDPILNDRRSAIVSEGKDIRFAQLTAPRHVSALCLPVNCIASTYTNKIRT